MKNVLLAILFLSFGASSLYAQAEEDDLLSVLGGEEPTQIVNASFKTNRVINLHSLENTSPGVMDFKISHRFGFLNNGFYDLFGLDNASMRLGFDFGLTDRLSMGIGRASYKKTYDGFVKYKILRQKTGRKAFPVTVAYIGTMAVNTLKTPINQPKLKFNSKLFYTHQLLIGRKFTESISVQVAPILVHRNVVKTKSIDNDIILLALAGRVKLSKRVSLNLEYIPVIYGQIAEKYTNSLSIGFDIETGGHVFQVHFTNSTSMSDHSLLTETIGDWGKGDIHFGFNISRVFTLWEGK